MNEQQLLNSFPRGRYVMQQMYGSSIGKGFETLEGSWRHNDCMDTTAD